MTFCLQAACAILGLCLLIPIVGLFSAMNELHEENQRLRRRNPGSDGEGPSPR